MTLKKGTYKAFLKMSKEETLASLLECVYGHTEMVYDDDWCLFKKDGKRMLILKPDFVLANFKIKRYDNKKGIQKNKL